MMKYMKTGVKAGMLATLLMTATGCADLDIVPEGKTTLSKTSELEMMFNNKSMSSNPNESLGILVNEDYGRDFSKVADRITNKNTLASAFLTYNEDIDRAALTTKDNAYTYIYKTVNYMNVVISKIDGAQGDDDRKPSIKAEAKVTRAYFLFLAANMYAKQYDAATASLEYGIAYPVTPDVGQKQQLMLDKCYEMMLEDCSDENINQLLDKGNVSRITKGGGNAVKALILFQMKRYAEALPYALRAIAFNDKIEDRSKIVETQKWELLPSSENNFFYVSPLSTDYNYPYWEQLSVETAALFESGDYVFDYAKSYGDPFWDPYYGELDTGIEGCLEASGSEVYANPWGITVEQMMYLAAECYIRTGEVAKGLDLVNKVRYYRIDSEHYQPFTASTETEAMELLQRAKFIECIGSYVNFIDRRRWNTEEQYKKTITRDLGDLGKYSIAPDSKLWVMPFPVRVMENNDTFRQNY